MTEREAFAPASVTPTAPTRRPHGRPNQPMCMHHELSYTLDVPGLMLFACLTAPRGGRDRGGRRSDRARGAAPRAGGAVRARRVAAHPQLHRRDRGIVRRGVRHDDRAAVERYCRANMIETAWQADGGLRTRQRRPAVVRHPVDRPALLVQPDRLPQPVDAGAEGARVPRRGLRRRRAAVRHPLRQRRPDRRGRGGRCSTRSTRPTPSASPGRPATCYSSTTSAPRTAASPTPGRARWWSAWRTPFRPRPRPAVPTASPTAAGPATTLAVPPFAVIPGGQVQRALAGRESEIVALVEAAYRWHGGGESVNPPSYFLRFPDRPTARIIALPASLGGRCPGGRAEVDLQLPRQRGGRDPPGVGGADPQRPRDRLPVRRAWRARSSAPPAPPPPRPWRPTG